MNVKKLSQSRWKFIAMTIDFSCGFCLCLVMCVIITAVQIHGQSTFTEAHNDNLILHVAAMHFTTSELFALSMQTLSTFSTKMMTLRTWLSYICFFGEVTCFSRSLCTVHEYVKKRSDWVCKMFTNLLKSRKALQRFCEHCTHVQVEDHHAYTTKHLLKHFL